jgi:hypothetical protein
VEPAGLAGCRLLAGRLDGQACSDHVGDGLSRGSVSPRRPGGVDPERHVHVGVPDGSIPASSEIVEYV